MHNKVVFHAMKALHSFGFPVLRFNFRGTGLSAGQHDEGRGEVADVQAALAWLKQEFCVCPSSSLDFHSERPRDCEPHVPILTLAH